MKWLHALANRFGRRGGILALFGITWALIGLGFVMIDREPRFSRPGPGGPLEFMDTIWPGWFWIICGAVALLNGLLRRRLDNEDGVGYAALTMPPILWTIAYALSYGYWLFTDGAFGREGSVIGLFVFLIMAAVLTIISGWPDQTDVKSVSSRELALLDRLDETHIENRERGHRAREASEEWIRDARVQSEINIRRSAEANDHRLDEEGTS